MERHDDSQLELFSSGGSTELDRRIERDSSFFARIRAYEKTILIIIALVVIGIIGFALGIEKGRKMASIRLEEHRNEPSQAPVSPSGQPPAVPVVNAPVVVPLVQPAADVPRVVVTMPVAQNPVLAPEKSLEPVKKETGGTGRYTIQLASYKSKAYAQKESDQLKKKGYSPVIVSKGDYVVLYVGRFQSKEKAQSLLAEFRKHFSGCYIRRL